MSNYLPARKMCRPRVPVSGGQLGLWHGGWPAETALDELPGLFPQVTELFLGRLVPVVAGTQAAPLRQTNVPPPPPPPPDQPTHRHFLRSVDAGVWTAMPGASELGEGVASLRRFPA